MLLNILEMVDLPRPTRIEISLRLIPDSRSRASSLKSILAFIHLILYCTKTTPETILARIDVHLKIKEKLGHDLRPIVILGACNPKLAYEAYCANSDFTSLLPCNVLVRELSNGVCSVEITKPSALKEILGDENLQKAAFAGRYLFKESYG